MNKRIKTRIVVIIISTFILFSLFSIIYTIFSPIDSVITINSAFYLLGRLMGLLGFLCLSILIFSGDIARFFDRFFGMDKIIKFQRQFALITTMLVLSHPLFFILSNKSYLGYLIPGFALIPFALGTFAFYIFIIVMVSSVLYKRISYKAWQYIHILIYVLFFFGLYHAVNAGSDSGTFLIRSMYSILFIFIIIGVGYRTNYKFKQRKNKFYVRGIRWETKNTFTLIVEPQQKFAFKPGQFCFLRLNKNRLYARHPFTISNAPENKYLNFTMKNTGKFTQTASQLKEGEEIMIDGPFGVFTLEDSKRNLVFIAGGVGITPFMSIIKSHLHSDDQQNITLLYGSETEKDIIFKKELDEIKEGWLRKIYVLSKEEKSSEDWERGYINKEVIEKNVANLENSLFYVCGPELMKNKMVKILKEMGIKKKSIKIESFFW